MNNKGFMMAEVVVVSSVVLIALVGLYTSYSKIFSMTNQRINYYDVATLYELDYIRSGIDFSVESTSLMTPKYNDDGVIVYYINKNNIINLKSEVSNQTFKDYLDYLDGSLDINNLNVNGNLVDNILVMEKCSGANDCKYAYLEVLV